MRLAVRGDGILERIALGAGLVPTPAGEAWGGVAVAGVLLAAVRVGLPGRLAGKPATVAELAADLDLNPPVLELLLDCLVAAGHVRVRKSRYRLSRKSRRWLDPASQYSVTRFIEATADYWSWWERLPETLRTGQPGRHHDYGPDDPYWRRYIYGQLELARLCAGEVGAKLKVPDGARSCLDIGGGHGWYSAELCRRHPALRATVLDLPGAVRIGRGITESTRVSYREGDALTADLGGPHDLILCFNLIHHFTPDEVIRVFTRIRDALAPGGTLAIMDGFVDRDGKASAAAHYFGLFAFLSSGSRAFTVAQLDGWLVAAGLRPVRVTPVRRIPGLAIHEAAVGPPNRAVSRSDP